MTPGPQNLHVHCPLSEEHPHPIVLFPGVYYSKLITRFSRRAHSKGLWVFNHFIIFIMLLTLQHKVNMAPFVLHNYIQLYFNKTLFMTPPGLLMFFHC